MAHVKKIPEWNKGNPLFKKAEHIPATEAPNTASAKAAARYKDPRIDIQIFKRAVTGVFYARIKFYSHVKPNWLQQADIDLKGSEKDLDFEVGVTCGAMAERLDELYGDNFDPEKSARQGSKTFAELLRAWELETKKKG